VRGKKGSQRYKDERLGPRHKQPGSTRYCKDLTQKFFMIGIEKII